VLVRAQDRGQQDALAAADVGDGPQPREVVAGGHAGRERLGPFGHRGVEPGAPLGVLV
jgi:hypothetical protein